LIVPNNLYAADRPSAKAAMQGVALPNDLHKMLEIETMGHTTTGHHKNFFFLI
jgi:hypothetical protein